MLKKLVLVISIVGVFSFGFSPTEAQAQMGSAGQDEVAPQPIDDPFEPFNQAMLSFNLKLDEYILYPVASGYAAVLPLGARQGVGRFFHNINIAPRLGNKLLQMKLVGAGREFSRFVINTSLGGLGFFDVADSWFGLEAGPCGLWANAGAVRHSPRPVSCLAFLRSLNRSRRGRSQR